MPKKNHEDDVAFIKALAELLNENDLTELEVTREYGSDDSLSVLVSRRQEITQVATAPTATPVATAPAAAPAANGAGAAPAAAPGDDPADHPGAVTSPMVGTVYTQAEPGAPTFVSVGQSISEGDTVLIIEAMKTMNHIPAPRSGTVKRILVEDGSTVEFGSPLMIIE